MAGSSTDRTPTLTAVYKSSTAASRTFTEDIPVTLPKASTPLPEEGRQLASTTDAKTVHLSALRSAVKRLQDDVNGFLTARMEADKTSATDGQDTKLEGARDEEEDNNGEEVADEGET